MLLSCPTYCLVRTVQLASPLSVGRPKGGHRPSQLGRLRKAVSNLRTTMLCITQSQNTYCIIDAAGLSVALQHAAASDSVAFQHAALYSSMCLKRNSMLAFAAAMTESAYRTLTHQNVSRHLPGKRNPTMILKQPAFCLALHCY